MRILCLEISFKFRRPLWYIKYKSSKILKRCSIEVQDEPHFRCDWCDMQGHCDCLFGERGRDCPLKTPYVYKDYVMRKQLGIC